MIRNIIFDMGQVLICWYPALLIQGLSLPENDQAQVLGEVFRSVEWIRIGESFRKRMQQRQYVNAFRSTCIRLPGRWSLTGGNVPLSQCRIWSR